jgi:hypothetical protein
MVHYYTLAHDHLKKKTALSNLEGEVKTFSDALSEIEIKIEECEKNREIQRKQLSDTIKEIEKLNSEKQDSQSILKKLKEEFQEMNKIIENTLIIEPIIVGGADGDVNNEECDKNVYDLMNGLVDLNRDIIMKLVKMMGDERKTRNV